MSRIHFFSLFCLCLVIVGCQRGGDQAVVEDSRPAATGQDVDTRLSLARVREQEGRLTEAQTILQDLVKSTPDHPMVVHRLGIVLFRNGQFDEGLKWLIQADSMKPNDPQILSDLGYACLTMGRTEQAQGVLETALELDPQNERCLNNLALAHGLGGHFDEAHALFSRTMAPAEAFSNLGYVATQVGKTEFAIDCYSRALDLDPTLEPAKEGLAQLAELDVRIQERKAIAAASRKQSPIQQVSAEDSGKSGVQQADATK